MAKPYSPPAFQLQQEVWALYDRKFALKKIIGVCRREKERDYVYFLEGMAFGNDGWYLEEQLFESKKDLVDSMNY